MEMCKRMAMAGLLSLGVVVSSAAVAQGAETEAVKAPSITVAAVEKININTADAETLQKIKGVGPRTADAIVQWREQEGPFVMTDQLMAIRGIGEKTFAAISGHITVE